MDGRKHRSAPIKTERARELSRSMTPSERILWQHLRDHQMNGLHFRRQHVIRGFIADFYCHEASLVIEVDGGIHRHQVEQDRERDAILASYNLRILRVTNDEIRNHLPDVLSRIRALCAKS